MSEGLFYQLASCQGVGGYMCLPCANTQWTASWTRGRILAEDVVSVEVVKPMARTARPSPWLPCESSRVGRIRFEPLASHGVGGVGTVKGPVA